MIKIILKKTTNCDEELDLKYTQTCKVKYKEIMHMFDVPQTLSLVKVWSNK